MNNNTFQIVKIGDKTPTGTKTLSLLQRTEIPSEAGPILSSVFRMMSVDADKFDESGKEDKDMLELPMELLNEDPRMFTIPEGDRAGEEIELIWLVAKDQ